MEHKNYSTIRSILKKAQGEKIAPYVFKINDTVTASRFDWRQKASHVVKSSSAVEQYPWVLKIDVRLMIGCHTGRDFGDGDRQ